MLPMKHSSLFRLFTIIICIFTTSVMYGENGNVHLPLYPSISPDGSEIVLSWRGDLWKVSAKGGTAVRLSAHPGNELHSAWHPNGKQIAFESDRDGYGNLYIMNADGTDIRQLTEMDRDCELTGFGVDEKNNEIVTFSSDLEGDLYRSHRPFMVSLNGGEILRVHDAYGFHPLVSSDGNLVAFTRGGSSWSRRHYRGSDDRDVWLYDRKNGSFTTLTDWEGNDGKAKWGNDDTLYFLSDREFRCVNLYRMKWNGASKTITRLTSFKEDDIQDYDISANGKTAVLLVWDTLHTLRLTESNAEPKAITIEANEDDEDNYQIKSIDREISEAALSPDEKVMAYIAYGEVYIRNVEEKSPTQRVTNSHAHEKEIVWSPDGLKLYFVSDRNGTESIFSAAVALTRSDIKEQFDTTIQPSSEDDDSEKDNENEQEEAKDDDDEEGENEEEEDLPKELDPKRWHDAIQFTITPIVETETNDRMPDPSPDGKHLAFRRGRGDLMILDLDSGDIRTLISGWDFSLDWRWSPDSRFIAYHQNDRDFNSDIWIIPVDGSKPAVNISRHPNNDIHPRWSADGKILSFLSERINNEYDLWMVYLDKELEALTPKEIEQYYKDAAEAAKKRKPLKTKKSKDEENGKEKDEEKEVSEITEEYDLTDAYLRLKRITTLSGNEMNNEMTPAGDRYIFTGTSGESGLFSIKWDGSDLKRLTNSSDVQHLTLNGEKIVIVRGGQGGTVTLKDGKTEFYDIDDEIHIDLEKQNSQKFLEAARILGEIFYHPTMKGLEWDALALRYHALAKEARTAHEFDYVANHLLGELNGSHLGIRAPSDRNPNAQSNGYLGTIHRRVEDGFLVTKIIPESPAAKEPMNLLEGDVVTSVEGKPFTPTDTLTARLKGQAGEETLIGVRRKMEDGEEKEIQLLITPISWGQQRQLNYEAWRLDNAELVEQLSDGRIGYIHVQAMNQPSLDVFERDLFAAAGDKDGLIIDVRNNGGGWTTDRLLASIMVQPHAYTVPRGADPTMTTGYPQDRLFIQRYTLPINMLCNEKSFSNAEIVSHAFKTLERGTLVGQETHGAVISTGGTRLIDGTTVRLPFRGWYVLDGTDMENHGAVPHVIVPQTPEAESKNQDDQLRAAVENLLKRLP